MSESLPPSARKINADQWGSTLAERWVELLQPCVLGFGLFQDGNVGVGVFPEGEEVFVSGECTNAGSIGIGALRGS